MVVKQWDLKVAGYLVRLLRNHQVRIAWHLLKSLLAVKDERYRNAILNDI